MFAVMKHVFDEAYLREFEVCTDKNPRCCYSRVDREASIGDGAVVNSSVTVLSSTISVETS